jgi:hypothetical protein
VTTQRIRLSAQTQHGLTAAAVVLAIVVIALVSLVAS